MADGGVAVRGLQVNDGGGRVAEAKIPDAVAVHVEQPAGAVAGKPIGVQTRKLDGWLGLGVGFLNSPVKLNGVKVSYAATSTPDPA